MSDRILLEFSTFMRAGPHGESDLNLWLQKPRFLPFSVGPALSKLSRCLCNTTKASTAAREIDRAAAAIGEPLHPDFLGFCIPARILALNGSDFTSRSAFRPKPEDLCAVIKVLWRRGAANAAPFILHEAMTRCAQTNALPELETLLALGVAPNARDFNGHTALSLAAREASKLPLLRRLLDAGADPNFLTDGTPLPHKGIERGISPLASAVLYGNLPGAEALLSRGADPAATLEGSLLFEHNRCSAPIAAMIRSAYERHSMGLSIPEGARSLPKRGM